MNSINVRIELWKFIGHCVDLIVGIQHHPAGETHVEACTRNWLNVGLRTARCVVTVGKKHLSFDREENGGTMKLDKRREKSGTGDTVNWIGYFSSGRNVGPAGSLCLVGRVSNVHPHSSQPRRTLLLRRRFLLLRNLLLSRQSEISIGLECSEPNPALPNNGMVKGLKPRLLIKRMDDRLEVSQKRA
ncbi:hypothetical protein KM043_005667 [Ampulex compressa]|nr:hypothetical protein KM043_005667 [Ampulex compressa]